MCIPLLCIHYFWGYMISYYRTWYWYLCCTMACFSMILCPYPWSPVWITPLLTTFCRYYPCVHYFYVPWLITTSQRVMTLLRMRNCGITVVNDVARDCIVTSQWVMTLQCVHIIASQWIMMLLWTSFARYYYAKLWYCCFTSNLYKIVRINH